MGELVLERYELVNRLAVGGTGEVFLAQQKHPPHLERPVILKMLLPELARHPEFVQRFLSEAQAVSTLRHRNLASLYEVGPWRGTYALAIEHVDGLTVAEVLRLTRERGHTPPARVVARIGVDVARGLHFAHTAQDLEGKALRILHREVKPSNILVGSDGVCRLLDLGLAHFAEPRPASTPGVDESRLAYASPEQIRGQALSPSTDQFSLGAVLWELLTGLRPFKAETSAALLAHIERGLSSRPADASENSPSSLEQVVRRMLRADPAERFADCAQACAALGAAAAGLAPKDLGDFLRDLAAEPPTSTAVIKPPRPFEPPPLALDRETTPYQSDRALAPDGALVGHAEAEVSLPPAGDRGLELGRTVKAKSSRLQSHDTLRPSLSSGEVRDLKAITLPPEAVPPLKLTLPPALERGLANHERGPARARSRIPRVPLLAVAALVLVIGILALRSAYERPAQLVMEGVHSVASPPDAGETVIDPETGLRRTLLPVDLAQIPIQFEAPVLIIESEPPEATVYLNGQAVGQTPWAGDGPIDGVTVTVARPGYKPWKVTLDAGVGLTTTVKLLR